MLQTILQALPLGLLTAALVTVAFLGGWRLRGLQRPTTAEDLLAAARQLRAYGAPLDPPAGSQAEADLRTAQRLEARLLEEIRAARIGPKASTGSLVRGHG